MSGKPWYMKLEASKVLADGGLAICSLAARGAWMWLLMRMHADGATGVWEGTPRQLALLVGAIDEPIGPIIDELRGAGVGDFEDMAGGRIRITSRRMKREADVREKDRERKAESHSNSEPFPEQFQSISDAFSDYDYKEVVIAEREEEDAGASFEKAWAAYGHKVNRKNAERAWRAMSKTNRAKALEAIPAYVGRTDPQGAGGLTIRAHFATWLRAERWNDETPAAVAHTNGHAKRPCTNCGGDLGQDHASHQGRPYCGPCYDRAPWLTSTKLHEAA